jgi:hypothetical protein
MAVCRGCSRESRLVAHFDDERRCPVCRPRLYTGRQAMAIVVWGCTFGGLVVATTVHPAAWLLALLGLHVIQFLLSVLHETAHALVARLVGWRVHFVGLGTARLWRTVRLGSVLLLLGRRPWSGGFCGAAPAGDASSPGADAAILAAPLVFHAAAAGAALPWAALDSFGSLMVSLFLVENLYFLALAAWPGTVRVAATNSPTDGKALLDLWREPEAGRKRRRLARWANPVYARIVESRFEDALALAGEAVERNPGDPDLLALLGSAAIYHRRGDLALPHVAPLARAAEEARPRELRGLTEQRLAARGHVRGAELEDYIRGGLLVGLDRFDEALSLSERRVERATSDEARALWSACLAQVLLLRGRPEDLDRAEQAARFAFERLPWVPFVEVTWGIAKIERGEARAGSWLFGRAARGDPEGSTAEMRAAWGIAAHAAEGRSGPARRLFARQRVWYWPACRRRAERALSGVR